MDGSEDDILFDDVYGGNSRGVTDDSVNDGHEETDAMDYYDAGVEMTDADIQKLFESDDEEGDFLGFLFVLIYMIYAYNILCEDLNVCIFVLILPDIIYSHIQ